MISVLAAPSLRLFLVTSDYILRFFARKKRSATTRSALFPVLVRLFLDLFWRLAKPGLRYQLDDLLRQRLRRLHFLA